MRFEKSKLLSESLEVEAKLPASAAVLAVPVHLVARRIVIRPETGAAIKSERRLWLSCCTGMVIKAGLVQCCQMVDFIAKFDKSWLRWDPVGKS